MFHKGGGSGEFEHNIPHLHPLDPSTLNGPLQPFVMVLVPYNYSLSPKYWGAKEREKIRPWGQRHMSGLGHLRFLRAVHISSVAGHELRPPAHKLS